MSKKNKQPTEKKGKHLAVDSSDEDSDYEDFSKGIPSVDVGLIDDAPLDSLNEEDIAIDRIWMKSPFFPSKIGGKPAWLDYANIPLAVGATIPTGNKSDQNNNNKPPMVLKCDKCNSQLSFLLQIYAPITDSDKNVSMIQDISQTFHRILYVFLCANSTCESRTFRVMRSQISRSSDYFSFDPPPSLDDGENDLKISKAHLFSFYKNLYDKHLFNLCSVCGLASTKKCSKCCFSYYCSQVHQVMDWTKLNHKATCIQYSSDDNDAKINNWINDENSNDKYSIENDQQTESDNISRIFPEKEITIEPEEFDYSSLKKEHSGFKYNEEEIQKHLDDNDANDNDFENIKENDYDKDFEKFKKISAHESTQVVRYERGGKPLWCTKYGKLTENNIPNCEHCGAIRLFEFQVTPQILNHLKLNENNTANSIDWAGLYIFTCSKSCSAGYNSYSNEFIYKQVFTS